MRVALTGGRGYVGQFILEHLLDEAAEITATATRVDPRKRIREHERLKWHEWRLNDATCGFEFLEGADYLIHTAFDHVPGRYRGGEGDDPVRFIRNNLLGTLKLWQHARNLRIKRTVFISSRAVFGKVAPSRIETPIRDEQSPFPDTLYGFVKSSIEAVMVDYADIGLCSIRPTGVYGVIDPIEKSKWYELCSESSDSDNSIDESDQAKTEVHGGDVARAITLMLNAPDQRVVGRAFNCSDVVISTNQLKYFVQQLRERKDNTTILADMPSAVEPHHEMSSEGLIELGWQRRGVSKVLETLECLLDGQLVTMTTEGGQANK